MWVGLAIAAVLASLLLYSLAHAGREHEETAAELEWLRQLPEADAKAKALELLSRQEIFSCKPANDTRRTLAALPPSVQDLFSRFDEITAGEFVVACSLLQQPARVQGFTKVGEDFEYEQILVRPGDPCVYSSYGDAAPDEPLEAWPSVWHRIILASDCELGPGRLTMQ